MSRTKGSKNKASTETKRAVAQTERPPAKLTTGQRAKAKTRAARIAVLERQIAEWSIELDRELDGLAEDMAILPAAQKPRKPRAPKLPNMFAPEQGEEAAE